MKENLTFICGTFGCLVWIRFLIYGFKENKDIKNIVLIFAAVGIIVGLIPYVRSNLILKSIVIGYLAVDVIVLFALRFVRGFKLHFNEAYEIHKTRKENRNNLNKKDNIKIKKKC